MHTLKNNDTLEYANHPTKSTVQSNLRRLFGRSNADVDSHSHKSSATKASHPRGDASDGFSSSSSTDATSGVSEPDISPSQEQIDLVRASWERVSELRHPTDDPAVSPSHAFGLAFYDALFQMNSELRPLFTNIFQQARALTGIISYIARVPSVMKSGSRVNVISTEIHGSTVIAGDTRNIHCDTNEVCPFTGIERSSRAPHPTNAAHGLNARKREREVLASDADAAPCVDEGDPEWLVYKLTELGARHYYYHVQPHHLNLVGPAFVVALKARLGREYDPRIGEAWLKAHAFAAYHMKVGLESQLAWENGARGREPRRNKAACIIQ